MNIVQVFVSEVFVSLVQRVCTLARVSFNFLTNSGFKLHASPAAGLDRIDNASARQFYLCHKGSYLQRHEARLRHGRDGSRCRVQTSIFYCAYMTREKKKKKKVI